MGLQKHMTLKRTKLLIPPNNQLDDTLLVKIWVTNSIPKAIIKYKIYIWGITPTVIPNNLMSQSIKQEFSTPLLFHCFLISEDVNVVCDANINIVPVALVRNKIEETLNNV